MINFWVFIIPVFLSSVQLSYSNSGIFPGIESQLPYSLFHSFIDCTIVWIQHPLQRNSNDQLILSVGKLVWENTIKIHFTSDNFTETVNTSVLQLQPLLISKLLPSHCLRTIFVPILFSNSPLKIMSYIERLNSVLWRRNRDIFVFYSENKTVLDGILLREPAATRIKHKLGLVTSSQVPQVIKACCFCGEYGAPATFEVILSSKTNFQNLIADPSQGFNGKKFSVSISTRATDLNEIREIAPGKWKPIRGLFCMTYLHLSSKLNFTGNFFPSSGGGGTGLVQADGSWNGITGDLINGKADLGYAIGQVYSRNLVIDYAFPVTYTRLLFVTGQSKPSYSWRAIYWPLDAQAWGFVLGSMAFTWLVLAAMAKVVTKIFGNKAIASSWIALKIALNYLLTTLLEQSKGEMHKGHSVRMISAFWLIFGILVTTCYKSKLVSLISFPLLEQPPKTFKELGRAGPDEYKIYLHYFGGAAFEIFKSSTSPEFRVIFERLHLEKDALECFQAVVSTTHKVCIAWESVVIHVGNRNLTDKYGYNPVMKAPDSSSFIVVTIGFPKMSVLKENFDLVINRAVEMGLREKWMQLDKEFVIKERREWERKENVEALVHFRGSEDDADLETLRMEHFTGMFGLWAIGVFLALNLGCIEMLNNKASTCWRK